MNYIELTECFCASDYFLLTKLNKKILYEKRPSTYGTFFKLVMNCYASKQDTSGWLEKTPDNTYLIERIQKCYPDANFIAIERNIIDTIKSAVKLNNPKHKKLFVLKWVLQYTLSQKHIDYFYNKKNLKKIHYENLIDDKEKQIMEICEYIDINFESSMLTDEYSQNTSFKNESKSNYFTRSELMCIKCSHFILKLLPYQIYRFLYFIYIKYIKSSELPASFYKFQREKMNKLDEM